MLPFDFWRNSLKTKFMNLKGVDKFCCKVYPHKWNSLLGKNQSAKYEEREVLLSPGTEESNLKLKLKTLHSQKSSHYGKLKAFS